MSGINSIQVHLEAQAQAILAALRSGNFKPSENKNRIDDTRPYPSPLVTI